MTDTDSVAGPQAARRGGGADGGGCGVIGEAAMALADVEEEYGRLYDRWGRWRSKAGVKRGTQGVGWELLTVCSV